MARRRYQRGQVTFSEGRQIWLGRYYEDVVQADGTVVRKRPKVVLGTKKELPTRPLALRKMESILNRINDYSYKPVLFSTVAEFAKDWKEKVLSRYKPSSVASATSHLNYHIIPKLGKLRLDQLGPENQQVFINQLGSASRKTVSNVLMTLGAMLKTAEKWGYATRKVELSSLVLPERSNAIAPHFTRAQMEGIFRLAGEPWRTLFILHALTGMRVGETLALQWPDIDLEHGIIHIHRSIWRGRVQSTKSVGSAVPVSIPMELSGVLHAYKAIAPKNPDGFLFVNRNGRPYSANKAVQLRLWPILDMLNIPRCGFHAFRHGVASIIVDEGFSTEDAQKQLRHADSRTTLRYIHRPSDAMTKVMSAVAKTFNLDTVGPDAPVN